MGVSPKEIGQARIELLSMLLENFKVPNNTDELVVPFRNWCRKNHINPDTQTLRSPNFRRFLGERRRQANKARERARSIIHLFEMTAPLWRSAEAVQEANEKEGWNACLGNYIQTGKIPPEKSETTDNLYQRAQAVGHNKARRKLQTIILK